MKTRAFLITIPSCFLLALTIAHAAPSEQLLKTLPAAAQKTIAAETGEASLVSITPKPKDGATNYKVVLNDHGKQRKLVIDASGKVLSVKKELPTESLPAAVLKRVSTESQGAKIEKSTQINKDGKTLYEVEFQLGGHERELVLDASGEVIKTEDIVALSTVPAPTKQQIEKSVGHGKLIKIEAIAEKGKPMIYEAEYEADGHKSEIKIAADGKIISRE
jgi:uncharacterized membrane protein YkoI